MIDEKPASHHDIRKAATGRKLITDMHPCHIRETFDSMIDTLHAALGANITLSVHAQPGLPQIYADPHLLETVLLNLTVNAREAMPGGGELNMSAQVSEVDSEHVTAHAEARPGRFIRLAVADTGCGISPETLEGIFEPTFTTKAGGQGAGLGLAAVQSIVKQHRGWIETQSELGKGTIFRIYIPVLENAKAPARSRQAAKTAAPPAPVNPAHETILVVEDEPDLRDLVTQLLESRGYKTVSAGTGAQALEQWARHKNNIQLVLTDMVMPDGMTGHALAEEILAQAPDLPIIYTSGHTRGSEPLNGSHIDPEHFLAKPYRPAQLFEIVHRCLHRTVGQAA
jgi:two-component system cell cycle sensor histidine kinase/response regulator CckA